MSIRTSNLKIVCCQDLYDLVVQSPAEYSTTTCLDRLSTFYTTHVPEVLLFRGASQTRVTVTTVELHHFDGRRIWFLGVVALDDMPFMVIQNSGREGDDFNRRIITDQNLYEDAIAYLVAVGAAERIRTPQPRRYDEDQIIDATTSTADVASFDGYSLNEIRITPSLRYPDDI